MIRGPRIIRLVGRSDPQAKGQVEGHPSRDAPPHWVNDGGDTERIGAALLWARANPSICVDIRRGVGLGRPFRISGVAVSAACAMTLSLIANELAPASLTALMVFVVPMWLVQFTLRCLSSADRAGLGMLIVVAVALALGLGQLFVPDQMELLQALVLAFGVVVPAIIIWRAKAETETSEGGSS